MVKNLIIFRKMKKVSVIIPAYKRVHHTDVCIDSILKSKGIGDIFDLEIVVSDASPDDSVMKMMRKFKEFNNIKYIHEKKPIFVGESRRRGVNISTGDILVFSDSDIEVCPDTLSKLVKTFEKTPTAGMVTTKVIYKKGSKVGQIDRPRKEDRRIKIGSVTYQETNYGRFLGTYRKLFKHIGGYDSIFESRGEGVDLSCRYWRAGFPIVYNKDIIVYHHHDAPDSLTRTGDGTSKMFASLILMTYKYDINYENSPTFSGIMNHGRDFHDKKLFDPVLASSGMLDWFVHRYKDIKKSKKALPLNYDFKPQEVFTDEERLALCISKASDRIGKLIKQ
jgi:glycosyltransferase involved in cell wall biosynthesis